MKIIGIISTAALSLLLGIAAPAYAQHEQQGEKQDHPAQQQKDAQAQQHAQPQQQHAQPQQRAQQQQHAQPQQQHAQPQQRAQQQQHAQPQQQHAQPQQRAQQQQHAQPQQQHAQPQQRAQQQPKQDQNKQTQQRAQQQRGNQQPQRTQEQQRVQQSAWQQHRTQNWQSDHRTWQQRGGYNGYRIPDDRFRGYFGSDHGFRIYGLPFLVVGGYPRFQYQGYWISLVDPWPESWGNDWYDTDDVYVTYADNGYYLFDSRYPNVGIAINISR